MGARYLFCTKQVLRAGIVLYGFRLTFRGVVEIGLPAILIDAIIVAATIFIGLFVGRLLKMDKDLALLTSTGSAICGAAAVLGAEPVVKSEPHKNSGGRFDSRYFRHFVDVYLSGHVPCRHIGPDI